MILTAPTNWQELWGWLLTTMGNPKMDQNRILASMMRGDDGEFQNELATFNTKLAFHQQPKKKKAAKSASNSDI